MGYLQRWATLARDAITAVNQGGTIKDFAAHHDVNYNTLRGRISDIRSQRPELLDNLRIVTAQPDTETKSAKGLRELAEVGWQQWNQAKGKWPHLGRWIKLAFVTDAHLPYHDPYAVDLAAQVVSDFNPDVITAFSDVFEFEHFSQWESDKQTFEMIWDSDIQNVIDAHRSYWAIMRDAAPNAIAPALVGNHDYRLIRFLRRGAESVADYTFTSIVRHFIDDGVCWLGEGLYESYLELSPGLVILHGVYATKRRSTTAKNHFEDIGGGERSTIAGHVHAFGYYGRRGFEADYHSHTVGCLADLQPPYTNRRQNWQQGVLLGWFNPVGKEVNLYPVQFHRSGGYLVTHAMSREYRVKMGQDVTRPALRLADAA